MFLYSTADYTFQDSIKRQKCRELFCRDKFYVKTSGYLKRKKRAESDPHTFLPNYTQKASIKRLHCHGLICQ